MNSENVSRILDKVLYIIIVLILIVPAIISLIIMKDGTGGIGYWNALLSINEIFPGAIVSTIALLITVFIFQKQKKIADRQTTILEQVNDTVENVDDITTRLRTIEAVDKNVRSFFQIHDKNASEYKIVYPYKTDSGGFQGSCRQKLIIMPPCLRL